MTIYDDIEARRAEHIAKGYTPEHDDAEEDSGTLACAGASLALASLGENWAARSCDLWPYDDVAPPARRDKAPRQYLIDALACLVAEVERIDRTVLRAAE